MSRRASDPPSIRGDDVPFTGLPAGAHACVVWAPAKVNLFLEVLGKRSDGFHAVETLILAVDLFDTLEVRSAEAGTVSLECDPPGLPIGPNNLVWKAAQALRAAAGVDNGAAIRLTKRIPHEAGLGGGSSDAAATIAALNALWGLNWPRSRLLPVAATVGSDVGFFLSPPAGWCTGRGEVVEPVPVGGEFHFVIVKPPVGCPTADVYRRVTVPESPMDGSAVREALAAGDAERLARTLHNRLQAPAFGLRPEVEAVYRRLEACGPLGCLLSGSGSSVFGVCRDREHAMVVAGRMRSADFGLRNEDRYENGSGFDSAFRIPHSALTVFVVRSVRWP
jgi:4-diphosphocytidyl-2-C-methyl-D-erythritol kinase